MQRTKRIERLEEVMARKNPPDPPPIIIIRGLVAPGEFGPSYTGPSFVYLPGGDTLSKDEGEAQEAFEARAHEVVQRARIEQRDKKT